MAVKIVSVYPRNLERGLPTLCAAVALTDDETGEPLAFMEGGVLTAIRTGASAGVATDLLARSDAAICAIIGAGVQARTQLQAVAAVRDLREVRIYDVAVERAEDMAQWAMRSRLCSGAVMAADSADEAVASADVVCAATTARRPVFSAAALQPGTHINGVGSFTPDMQEIGEDVMQRAALIVVDSREATRGEAGDLRHPVGKGILTLEQVRRRWARLRPARSPAAARPRTSTCSRRGHC